VNEHNAESNYNKGINGIMVDLSTPGGNHSAISQANIATVLSTDFHFRVGTDNGSGITWADATSAQMPTGVSTTLTGGASSSDRVELTWPSAAVKNQWLEVQVKASADTGLADLGGLYAGIGDVFYFANKIGDLRNESSVQFNTTALDVAQIHGKVGSAGGDPNYLWDITKANNVTALSVAQAHANVGGLHWIDVSGGLGVPPWLRNRAAAMRVFLRPWPAR
jgi:hypothetical protein